MGFTLRITNPPPWAVWWMGWFTDLWLEGGGAAMPIDEVWDCPGDPLGHTTLVIQLFDVYHDKLYEAAGLGPVYSNKDYEYDYATGVLYELVPEEFTGTITRKELEYDGIKSPIPVY